MTDGEPRVRQNYLAILVAAIACFLFEAGWYSFFLQTWLQGIGRTQEWLEHSGINPAFQYATAIVCEAIMATAISCVTQLTGRQTLLRGIKSAALLWLGFVATSVTTGCVFEGCGFKPLCVNAGFWLGGMIVMGAIVGGWRKK